MGVLHVGCVLRDHPAVDPYVGAFLGDNIFQIRVFLLGVDGFTGVDNTQGSLSADHLISYLVYHIGLYQRLLLYQKLFGFLQFFFIGGIHGIAQQFKSYHKGVPFGILHQDIVLVFLIPENGPAVHGIGDHCLIIKNTYGTPAIGDGVEVPRIEAFRLLKILLTDICQGRGELGIIQGLQQIIVDHFLDHVIGRTDHIIAGGAGGYLGIHGLVGLILIIDHPDPCFLFKGIDGIRIDVFTPVIDIDHAVFAYIASVGNLFLTVCLSTAAGREGYKEQERGQKGEYTPLCLSVFKFI